LRWSDHVTRILEIRNANKVLVRNPEGKRPLEKPRRRWMIRLTQDTVQ